MGYRFRMMPMGMNPGPRMMRRLLMARVSVVAACLMAGMPRVADAQIPVVSIAPDDPAAEGPQAWPVPWPPSLPDPRPFLPVPPGVPPFVPPIGPADGAWWSAPAGSVPVLQDLAQFVAVLEQARDMVAQWAGAVQQAASDSLARMIWESPGLLPPGVRLPDLAGQITMIPPEVRAAIDALLAKLNAPVRPDTVDARHQAYVQSSPALANEAIGIAAADQLVTGMAVEQETASRATALGAAGAARDARLPAAISAGYQAGQMLLQGAGQVPSTRAGVELLVAASGMAMRQQADLGEAVADRLAVLAQQTAAVSQQIGTLAATAGTLVARETEHDRQALDARLGLADILSESGRLLRQMLAGEGEASGAGAETRIDPLY